ncbi:hypothetical protein J2TS4_52760 [Paenibacillus sp. J2TS4]|nr:hypothetical protein J2TS4_52760 [Paenibacillus sp. J2TS4]
MQVKWRKSAIESLINLDRWRASIELSNIAMHLKKTVQVYFERQDFSVYIPGRQVVIRNLPVDLRIVLVSVVKSDPYKVFYRLVGKDVEIFLIRHPNQRPLE